MKKRANGYSLVEVLVAIAITSVVLLTVVTLFYMGRRNVYSGKQTTYAVSVGTRILEDLSAMTAQDMIQNFGIDDSTATGVVTLNGVQGVANGKLQFNNSIARDTKTIDTTTDPKNYLSTWNGYIGNSKLASATAGLVITPRDVADNTRPITSARFYKVRGYISWDEGQRRRYTFFDTTKVNRD